jgi:hypothetical protein
MDIRLEEYQKHGYKSYIYHTGEKWEGVVLHEEEPIKFYNSDKELLIEEMVLWLDEKCFSQERLGILATSFVVLLSLGVLGIFAGICYLVVNFFEWLFK